MSEEIRGERWTKAIPEAGDRAQSRWLVGVCGLVLVVLSLETRRWTISFGVGWHAAPFAFGALAVSGIFALTVLALRGATLGGAACGGMICLLVTFWTGVGTGSIVRSGFTPLAFLFLLTFAATRAGRRQKARMGLAEARKGRSASQVIANLSVAGMCVSPLAGWALSSGLASCCAPGIFAVWVGWVMRTMCLAALVEATADTVSSEIGQAFGGQPVMMTSLRPVPPGTDGAVTALGSCAGMVGGAVVAMAGGWAMHLEMRGTVVALGAGVCGLFFDSLLGATLERRGWLGNDLVNFASTMFAAGLAGIGCQWLRF
jgi:uncharacterized protein (TIGR00297 family)